MITMIRAWLKSIFVRKEKLILLDSDEVENTLRVFHESVERHCR